MTAGELAPCVAVVGPANSGKTTFLHLLDRELQGHPDAPLTYVLQGNPDGTGRYLYEAPGLREELKPRVKGRWVPGTVETICRSIANCRATLELVVVDFGGRHSPEDGQILERCSHFLVVARKELWDGAELGALERTLHAGHTPSAGPPDEDGDARSWTAVCARSGLAPLAMVRSLWERGEPRVVTGAAGVLEADFRSDVGPPGEETNGEVIAAVARKLLGLRRHRPEPPYLNLHRAERWAPADLEDLAGMAGRLEERVRADGATALGGVAPTWAYAAALHRALDLDPEAEVQVFDPKLSPSLVTIPAGVEPIPADPESPLASSLSVGWSPLAEGEGTLLDIVITSPDRFLALECVDELARAPIPQGSVPEGPLVISGRLPIWLALTYSRLLRQIAPGQPIGQWDAGTEQAVIVHGGAGEAGA